jgi:8-oxo-dGTP pyrophosphatase MutT (NUDIX family)/phosphohistidine phosphatase SixA
MPSNKPGSRLIRAAGGVAWRPGPDGRPQVLLVHRKKYDDWSLPKGKIEPGEPLPVTAVREVLEEGGARLALGRRLASVRYNVGGRPKRVHYWAARVLSVDSRAIPNAEVDQVAWLPADRAVEKVSYPRDHGVLADFAARPPHTFPLILLRHAKALPKGGWKRADTDRPLDDSGRYAAKALADLLACFSPSFQLITSPAARCTETLRPLSELTGDPVRKAPTLYIHYEPATGAADPGTVNAALIRAAIESGQPTVVCAHRENLPALRAAALAALSGYSSGEPSPGAQPPGAESPGAPAAESPAAKAPGGRAPAAKAPGGKPSRGAKAADGGDAPFELPKDWDETLPPSGFWVLNIAPFPAQAEAGPQPAPEPEPPAAAALSRRRTWWQRLHALARRGGAGVRPDDPRGDRNASGAHAARGEAGGQVRGDSPPGPTMLDRGDGAPRGEAGDLPGDAPAGDVTPAGPVGVLISADRYDLAELDES